MGDRVELSYLGRYVREVGLGEHPPYFDKVLSDGSKSENVIAVAGALTPGFFLNPDCYYFPEGKQCQFCSLYATRKTAGKDIARGFSAAQIAEATRLFQQTKWKHIPEIQVTAGSAKTDAETRMNIIEPIRAMYDALQPKIPIHAIVQPPDDFEVIREYRDAGVTTISFNIEVFDRACFARICPGKNADYGYDRWLRAVQYASEVFGADYRVYCGLVWGIEPTESTMRGNEFFIENRIGIASNIFHADPGTVMGSHPHPDEETLLILARHTQSLFRENPRARTIFSVSMRSTIDWEARRGDFS